MQSILVVDDHDYTREMICRFLKELGYHSEQANCGQQAFARIREVEFDLVLLDIYMEDCDGLALVRKIKLQKEMSLFVMMSAAGYAEDKQLARDLGALSFLVKPFEFSELKDLLEAVLPIPKFEDTWQLSAS